MLPRKDKYSILVLTYSLINFILNGVKIINKIYYSQKDIIDEISDCSLYPRDEIVDIFKHIEIIVKNIFLDTENTTEIRLLNGLKLTANHEPSKIIKSNLHNGGLIKTKEKLKLNAYFTKDYAQRLNDKK